MFLPLAVALALVPNALTAQDPPDRHTEVAAHQDATDYALPEGGKPAYIPFHFLGNQVRVDATINERGPFHLIVDTGMPIPGVLLFQSERVDALGLEASGSHVAVAGAGGEGSPTEALMASGLAVALGDLKLSKASALIVPTPAGFPPGADGVIGGALFFHFVVEIDMDRERLQLHDSAHWTPPAGACIVPIVREAGKAFVDIRVAVGTEEPVPARVVIDTGGGHALSLNSRENGLYAPPASAIEAPLGRGMSGVVLGKAGRVRRVEIGTFAFDDVVTSFPGAKHQNPGGADFHDGNLGEEILKRFNVTFDYAGNRMVLQKARGFAEPFDREMAGTALDWEKDGTATIRSVMPRSPAAAAGIQEGDRLIAIDGKPLSTLGEKGVHKALTVDGAEVGFTLRRGSEVVEKKVRLKRLV